MSFKRPGATWTKDHCCPECHLVIPQRDDFILHIGTHHRAVEQFLPAKWDCFLFFPTSSLKTNSCRYRLPTLPPTIPSRETCFSCPLPSCSATKETQKALLVHLLVTFSQFFCFPLTFSLFRLCTIGRTWNQVTEPHSGKSRDGVRSVQLPCSKTLFVT